MKSPLVRNAIAVLAVAGLTYVSVRWALYLTGSWGLVGQLVGAAVGLAAAWRFRAPWAAGFAAVLLAATLPELVVRLAFGPSLIQGAAVRFAVFGTSIVGVLLGILVGSTPARAFK
jgi:hypothetical protein